MANPTKNKRLTGSQRRAARRCALQQNSSASSSQQTTAPGDELVPSVKAEPTVNSSELSTATTSTITSSNTDQPNMPSFREENILIIVLGSQTTLVQLGAPEHFTDEALRLPTRMFPSPQVKGQFEPSKVRVKSPAAGARDGEATAENGTIEYEVDEDSDEDAVYPIKGGRVRDWDCFAAFLFYIYRLVKPGLQSPVLVVVDPTWTRPDREHLTRLIFELYQAPAFALADATVGICQAVDLQYGAVIDVGFEKCSVTAYANYCPIIHGRTPALRSCGGEAMTQKLFELLGPKGWTRDMCEQLKKSPICEILPANIPIPEPRKTAAKEGDKSPTSPTTTAMTGLTGANATGDDAAQSDLKAVEKEDGVLDIASIVVEGKTAEFISRKEKEKAEKAAKKAGIAEAQYAAQQAKLPNYMRATRMFFYEEREPEATAPETRHGETTSDPAEVANTTNGRGSESQDPVVTIKPSARMVRKEIEVGTERFMAASGDILDRIAQLVHRTIQAAEPEDRHKIWDNLVVVGGGSRVRGFKEALLERLKARYLLGSGIVHKAHSDVASSASTPLATGATTPQPQYASSSITGPSVNPLLVAATTGTYPSTSTPMARFLASLGSPQTPRSMKLVPEKKHGRDWRKELFWNNIWLGAQYLAKLCFIFQKDPPCYLTRQEYNERGPSMIIQKELV